MHSLDFFTIELKNIRKCASFPFPQCICIDPFLHSLLVNVLLHSILSIAIFFFFFPFLFLFYEICNKMHFFFVKSWIIDEKGVFWLFSLSMEIKFTQRDMVYVIF